jgi:two-component system, cell cycle sensor histidine kinase and response regulator CckA
MAQQRESAGAQTVLVVDDEPMVVKTVAAILASVGFSVLQATSAEQALKIAGGAPHIDLVLCDVIMPGMNGPQFAGRFAYFHPETPCLFMAGYSQHPEVVAGVLEPGLPLIEKPFLPTELVDKVREVLAARPDGALSARA